MRISTFSMLGALVSALLVAACSETRNPAAPKPPSFITSSSQSTTFSGDATVVRATLPLVGTIELAHAGPLPSSGGADEATVVEASVPGLVTAEVLHASTVGQGNHSRSEASVAKVAVTAGGNTIAAGFLMARAEAKCSGGSPSTSGSSEIAELKINEQTIVVSSEPNQEIALPNGRVVINEQQSAGPGDITVNALHVVVTGVADVIIASAHADIGCPAAPPPPPPPGCRDFVTGGGWITGTPTGARANFAVAGGIKNGAFWGHLNYIDHGPNLKVKGTGVTGYEELELGSTTRRIRGTAEVNGQGGFTYTADVTDNGEPGRGDVFDLQLSNGYRASGTLSGGNIQLHLCK